MAPLEYVNAGSAWLVCPNLLALDVRHGQHPDKWPPCRRGDRCKRDHKHERQLVDPEGHTIASFGWIPGCRPPDPHEWPECYLCGVPLVHADGPHPLDPEHHRDLSLNVAPELREPDPLRLTSDATG